MIHDAPQPSDHTHTQLQINLRLLWNPRCPIKAEHPGPFSFVRWVAMASRAALCSRALLRVSATGNNSQRVVQSVRQLHCSAAAAGAWGALMAAVCHVASCARDCRADLCALWLLHCISRAWRVLIPGPDPWAPAFATNMFASPMPDPVGAPVAHFPHTEMSYSGSVLSGTTPSPFYCGFAPELDASPVGNLDAIVDADTGVSFVINEPALENQRDTTMYADSTLRKRRAKMNKHKRRKWRRKMRNLGGKNLKQK